MLVSSALIATERPTPYVRQLCEHFAHESPRHVGHQLDVTFDDREGFVDFAPVVDGSCRLEARDGVLALEASGADRAALERIQRILTEHVERFGQRDSLTVEWGPAATRR